MFLTTSVPATADTWIKLLARYGPPALLVFVAFILFGMALRNRDLTGGQKRIQTIAFSFVWIFIFLLVILSAASWWREKYPQEFQIKGVITNLRDPEVISTRQELFLRIYPLAGRDFEYQWRLITPQRFTGRLELLLQKTPLDATVFKYEIPVQEDFYKDAVEIDYNRSTGMMTLRHGSLTTDIPPTADSASSYDRPPPRGAPGIAYAQNAPTPQSTKIADILGALDADNPIIRENARRDLAALGFSATPQIEAVLTDPQTSLRMRLEVLTALSTMRSIALSLSGPARCAIANAAHDPNEALRKAATNLLTAGVHAPPTCASPRGADKPQAVSQAVLHTKDWYPIDLAYDGSSGLFALAKDGAVYGVYPGANAPLRLLFRVPLAYNAGALAVASQFICVSVNPWAGDFPGRVFRYSLETGRMSEDSLFGSCGGIAAAHGNIYVVVSRGNQSRIEYWNLQAKKPHGSFDLYPIVSPGPLAFDHAGDQLIIWDNDSHQMYAISIADGKKKKVGNETYDLDNTMGVAVSSADLFAGSGKSLLFLSRETGRWRKIPALSLPLEIRGVNGLAMDRDGRLWIADKAGKVIVGVTPPT